MQTQEVKTYADECVAEAVKCYAFKFAENEFGVLEEMDDPLDVDAALDRALEGGREDKGEESRTTPSAEIHRLALAHQYDHPDMAYPVAVERVLSANPDLSRAYKGEVAGRPKNYSHKGAGDPSVQLHELVAELLESKKTLSYEEAAKQVLASHPELREAYAGYLSAGYS